jgi:hypothetical protein
MGIAINNAERIVACVNALAGLNPEAIKDVVEALERCQSALTTDEDAEAQLGVYGRGLSTIITSALAKLKQATP